MPIDTGRLILDFDPAHPQPQYFATATQMAAAISAGLRAEPVRFPAGLAPIPAPPPTPPDPSAPLPRADVLIATWTTAEADTLATLLTPGVPLDQWFEYKSNLAHYIPLVTGPRAPFNDRKSSRYYQSLGIYYPITLAGRTVICLKAGLHLDHDTRSPPPSDLPMIDLWKQMIAETGAQLVITTGTGGGIGANVLLGDVVVAAQTVFDCTGQFKAEPFKTASYDTSPLPAGWTPPPAAMTSANAALVAQSSQPSHPDHLPAFFYAGSTIPQPKIVTTDKFAFDDTTNAYGLQALGNVCDMGDAALGLVIEQLGAGAPLWAAIRNASDPQIDGSLPHDKQETLANDIYLTYGAQTSAASVLATWSLICAHYPPPPAAVTTGAALVAAPPDVSRSLARTQQQATQSDPAHILLQIAASSDFKATDAAQADIPPATVAALTDHLDAINVAAAQSTINWRMIRYVDETFRPVELTLAHVANDDAEAFRGSYLLMGAQIVAKDEFASS